MRLYCTTPERFPLRLVDVTELFFRELRRHGVEQTWFCGPGYEPATMRREYSDGVLLLVPPTFKIGGIAGTALTRLSYLFFETVFMLRQIAERPDGILVRDKYWGAVVAWAVTRWTGGKLFIWLSYPYPEHDDEEAAAMGGWRRWLRRSRAWLGYKMLYRFAMPRADHCFVQSEQMKRDLLAYGIPADKMTPVPMGISKSVFDAIETDGPLASPPTVLYLGTLAAVRKLEILVDAFRIVHDARPDARFLFVGSGNVPGEQEFLEARTREAGLSEVVTFTGQLPMAEAWKLTAAASACVSPFRTTPVLRVASPTKFVEYLAFAKPTVGNSHPEHSMIADESQGAITVEWSAQAFADAIVWCLDHPEDARQMGLRGRAWVAEHRTYDRLGNLVHDKLASIVNAPRD